MVGSWAWWNDECLGKVVSAEDAEFVALGVGEDDPGFVPGLAHVDTAGSEIEEAGHLGGLIIGTEIEVEPVLHDLLFTVDADDDARQTIGRLPDLDLRVVLVDDHPAERPSLTAPERGRVGRIDDDLLPFQ